MTDTKTALVTGANSGAGLPTVVEQARRGFRVMGTVRSEAKAVAIEEAAARAGVLVETRLLDARLTALAAETVPTPIQDRLTRRVLGL